MKKLGLLLMIFCLSFSLTGCGNKEEKVLTIAYAPNESTEQSTDARNGLAKDLEETLGVEVKEIQATDYNAIVEALRTGKADMAYMGALAVALANERAQAEPIVMKAVDGDKEKAIYHSLLVTKSNRSDINTIKDIKGKTMAFVDPESTSGNLVPTSEIINAFSNEKLTSNTLHTNGKFFEAVSYSGKHQAGLQALIKGDVDVVPISDQILASEISNGNVKESDIKIIHQSDPIPAEGFVVSKNMDKKMKQQIQDFLIDYNNKDYFKMVIKEENARFVQATIEDYQSVIKLNKTLNEE
ncbi:phosphate/phosphite/phosphonate ABC transporter substrate-binding protein [uncultured Thomasclavelia sp.]|uniref:phosphate/phosphite/phosphonate ABC transporter substrate-binding protein n=1 Tax=uncultured Thomasclavelia sp. TaxID=3025759 RepID=UPI00262B6171|nr:phosphate/phosphite/phosphonate ABC transporter substrate-binding protein [uncultured Thomasclavelia sp.]